MTKTFVGQQVTIKSTGEQGIVTWDKIDKNGVGPVMVSINGDKPTSYPIEMTDLPIEKEYPAWVKNTAKKYNVSPEVVLAENIAFLQSEGCFETASRTIECQTFDFWMKIYVEKHPYRVTEPWQKGDLNYGLS